MAQLDAPTALTRRELLQLGGTALATVLLPGDLGGAGTPRRGGVFRIRGGEAPTGFDPHLMANHHRIAANLSFPHSRLVKGEAGAAVGPGTQPPEPDLA